MTQIFTGWDGALFCAWEYAPWGSTSVNVGMTLILATSLNPQFGSSVMQYKTDVNYTCVGGVWTGECAPISIFCDAVCSGPPSSPPSPPYLPPPPYPPFPPLKSGVLKPFKTYAWGQIGLPYGYPPNIVDNTVWSCDGGSFYKNTTVPVDTSYGKTFYAACCCENKPEFIGNPCIC